jgi:hypothetical protein
VTILSRGPKAKLPVVFYRTALDPILNKEVVRYFLTELDYSVWQEEEFSDYSLVLMVGRTGQMVQDPTTKRRYPEPCLKVMLDVAGSTSELDCRTPSSVTGVTVKRSAKEEPISREKAGELISSGKAKFMKEENGQLVLPAQNTYDI